MAMPLRPLPARRALKLEIQRRLLGGDQPGKIADEFRLSLSAVSRIGREAAVDFSDSPACDVRLRHRHSLQLEAVYFAAMQAWSSSEDGGDLKCLSTALAALSDLRSLWRLESPPAETEPAGALQAKEDVFWYPEPAASPPAPGANGDGGA